MTRIDTIPASSTRGVTIALADLPDPVYSADVYLLGVHLKCCGNPGGSEDDSRQDSADAIANWLGDARGVARPSGNNVTLAPDTPMISLGDFNLVGGPQPETTLITGDIQDEGTYGPDVKGDWDNSNLTDLTPTDPFTGDTFTWQGNQNFPPGRLDRFFYTDSVVTVANSFILNTDTMTPAALAAAGLQAGDTLTQNSSDHLPIAMDLRRTVYRLLTVEHYEDDEIRSYLQERYGDFVLYDPPFKPSTWVLWLAPVAFGLISVFVLLRVLRQAPAEPLSVSETERLRVILDDD